MDIIQAAVKQAENRTDGKDRQRFSVGNLVKKNGATDNYIIVAIRTENPEAFLNAQGMDYVIQRIHDKDQVLENEPFDYVFEGDIDF